MKKIAQLGIFCTNICLCIAAVISALLLTAMMGIPGLLLSLFGSLVLSSVWLMAVTAYNKFMEE